MGDGKGEAKMGNRNKGDIGRRDFLRLGGAASVLAGTSLSPGVGSQARAQAQGATFPVTDVAEVAKIQPGAEIAFDYPDDDAPAVLLRLDEAAQGGIGPGESIVAFSLLCTHKGCVVGYKRDAKMLLCPCHWSSFDPAKAGRLIIGQASAPLPQITLRIADGKVQAVGVEGLIYGRHTNIL